jgi:hypothetical protein
MGYGDPAGAPTLLKVEPCPRAAQLESARAGRADRVAGVGVVLDLARVGTAAGRAADLSRVGVDAVHPRGVERQRLQVSDAGVWGAAVSTGWSRRNELFFPYDRDLVAIFDGRRRRRSRRRHDLDEVRHRGAGGAPTAAAIAGGALVDAHTTNSASAVATTACSHEGNESATVRKRGRREPHRPADAAEASGHAGRHARRTTGAT